MLSLNKTFRPFRYHKQSGRLTIALLVLLAVCLFSLPVEAQTSTYTFLPKQSTVVQTGGIAGVHETYGIEGQFQLTVDFDAGIASFDKVDANLTEPSGFLYTQSLGVLFNMTELTGTLVDETKIDFVGHTIDDTNTKILLTLTFTGDSAHLTGETIPPPDSADFFYYNLNAIARKKYGGTGEPNDPYQIATAKDLMLLSENPEDYDKHFVLTTDIDLAGLVFDKAVIAPDTDTVKSGYQGTLFAGVFDGNGHKISHLTIKGVSYLSLFGQLDSGAKISNLGLEAVDVNGTGDYVGGLVGENDGGNITSSYSTGTVSGDVLVGGLVGRNFVGNITASYSTATVSGDARVGGLVGSYLWGDVTNCYSTGPVTGREKVGGLVGNYYEGSISDSYSTGTVTGDRSVGGLVGSIWAPDITGSYSTGAVSGGTCVGGLVGENSSGSIATSCSSGTVSGGTCVGGLVGSNSLYGSIATSCSTGIVNGTGDYIGGLAGWNSGSIATSYSTGSVIGDDSVGGLVGLHWAPRDECTPIISECYSTGSVTGLGRVGGLVGSDYYISQSDAHSYSERCFWDTQSSGQTTSAGGTGKSTTEMQDPKTFTTAGWDLVGQADGPHDIWAQPGAGAYPVLWWQLPTGFGLQSFSGGTGEPNDPYLISKEQELNSIGHNPRLMQCHFRLTENLDLMGPHLYPIGGFDYAYCGVFDGNDFVISNLMINGESYVGLFGYLASAGEVKNLGLVDAGVTGSGWYVGGLVGFNRGDVTHCYTTGDVSSTGPYAGGLVGRNAGHVTQCYSAGAVTGYSSVGGLVGFNEFGSISTSYSTGAVSGGSSVGGLVGYNDGSVATSHSTGTVIGNQGEVGGLVGINWDEVTQSYSTGAVSGEYSVGGLVGYNGLSVTHSYSTGAVSGELCVGGLVGYNFYPASVTDCYSTGSVSGAGKNIGGLVGRNTDPWGNVGAETGCFWDVRTSGQAASAGGTGLTTAEMQTAATFLEAGWDFVGETENGTEDIWAICEGTNYPRLVWQIPVGDFVCPDGISIEDFLFFAEHWRDDNCDSSNDYCNGTDLDKSGTVDADDLEIFFDIWLAGLTK